MRDGFFGAVGVRNHFNCVESSDNNFYNQKSKDGFLDSVTNGSSWCVMRDEFSGDACTKYKELNRWGQGVSCIHYAN